MKQQPEEIPYTQGQEQLLKMLQYDGAKTKQAKDTYDEFLSMYQMEYGLSWVMKELIEAKSRLKSLRKTITGALAMAYAIIDSPSERVTRKYIIGKEVNQEQFALYSKGLYWMAAYDLLNNN